MDPISLETLAAIEHERWAHWQAYMHSKCTQNPDGSLTIPSELVQRWERQIATPFTELSDKEKHSDYAQAMRSAPALKAAEELGRQTGLREAIIVIKNDGWPCDCRGYEERGMVNPNCAEHVFVPDAIYAIEHHLEATKT